MKGFVKDANGKSYPVMLKAVPSNFSDGLFSLEVKEGAGNYSYIDDNDTHVVKASSGILRSIYIWDEGTAWEIEIKDGTTSLTGGSIAVSGLDLSKMNVKMTTNITIITANGAPAGKMLVIYD